MPFFVPVVLPFLTSSASPLMGGCVVGGLIVVCFFCFWPQSQTQEPPDYPSFVESVDEYHFVERLIPPTSIPKPPKHEHYPTPSGWQPPRGELGDRDGLRFIGGKLPLPTGLPPQLRLWIPQWVQDSC